ncbi:Zn-ribbon domain-containing OB-fold protein [Mycolicibacterium holsaticum]|uniref:Zn-ribbon domain-containing OB-fold protein n=1 Tax=Mycolicibacterium holsaticum TaxID=152142 RepID=UPI001C7D45E3|nr:OB-fold domain-containing protein [Mycolicibacterium holsaticum]QZA12371.1 OB-fold domain-containing protein [Mycolicibacterium holsaticum DSM 44478 = JCM 12374]UNC10145.1 OB-fold domain-containing protein [Mycolicibacterium holsaticum DSM 44478 = JCM 12374]
MSNTAQRPLPVVDDEETGGFWQAAVEHRLVVRACLLCGAKLHLPKSYCHHCGSWEVGWQDVRPTGSVYSWTVLHHTIHEAFPAPCTIVLVQLDDDPTIRFVGQLAGVAELSVGMPMRVRFEDIEPGVTLPQWEPARSAEATPGHQKKARNLDGKT